MAIFVELVYIIRYMSGAPFRLTNYIYIIIRISILTYKLFS